MSIAVVHQAVGPSATGSGTSLAASAISATGGNAIAVFVRVGSVGPTITVTDNAGNTYTGITVVSDGSAGDTQWFYALNITGNAALVVTAHWGSASSFRALMVYEISGIASASAFDAGPAGHTTTPITSAAFTTTHADEIMFCGGATGSTGNTYTAGGSATLGLSVSDGDAATEYQIVSSIQTGITMSFGTTGGSANVMTLKAGVPIKSATRQMLFGLTLKRVWFALPPVSTPRVAPARRLSFAAFFRPLRPGYSRFFKGGTHLPSQIGLTAFRNKRTLGNPTLIQAAKPFTYFIAGVDRSSYVDVTQAPSGTAQVNSRATATFRTVDTSGAGWTPTEGDSVQIFEGATLIFRGGITRTVEERLIKTTVPRVIVTCGDAAIKMANRAVNAFYGLDLYGSPYFITIDIVAKHLADLGITYVPRLTDLADLFPIGDQLFYCIPVSEALNRMAKLMNADWIIDLNNNLRYIGLTDAPSNGNGFTDSSGNWLEVKATRTLALEGNRIFAKSSAQLTQTQTDTFPGDPGGLYIMTYPPRDGNLLPVVKVNGVAKIVVTYNQASSGVPYDFYRIGTGVSMNGFHTPLSSSDTVTVTYPSPVPYVAVAEDAVDIAANGLKEVILECGNITSKTDLQAIADAWLLRLKDRATQLTITTAGNVQGTAVPAANRDWQPGQLVSVNLTASSGATPVVDSFLVDTVSWTIQQNTLRFQTLTLSNVQYQRTANPAKWMADIIARLRTIALPVTQVMTLSADTNLGSGFVLNVGQQINLDSSAGPFTVTLPLPSELYGNDVTFKKISSDSNLITILAPAGRTIDGFTTQVLSTQNQVLVLAGNQWQ